MLKLIWLIDFFSPPLFALFHPFRLFQLHSSWTAVIRAQGRGGWWESEFVDGRLVTLWISFSVASVSSQPALWFERQPSTWVGFRLRAHSGGCAAPEQMTPRGWACKCVTMETGGVTDTSRTQLLSCPLSFHPPPAFTTHWDTRDQHAAAALLWTLHSSISVAKW